MTLESGPSFELEAQTQKVKDPADFGFFLDKLEKDFDVDKSEVAQNAFAAEPELRRIYEARGLNDFINSTYIINLEDAIREIVKDPEESRRILDEVQRQTMDPNLNEANSQSQFTAMGIQAGLSDFERKYGKIVLPSQEEIDADLA